MIRIICIIWIIGRGTTIHHNFIALLSTRVPHPGSLGAHTVLGLTKALASVRVSEDLCGITRCITFSRLLLNLARGRRRPQMAQFLHL